MEDFLPLAKPDISEDDIAEVVDTLRSGWLVYGPKTQAFEEQFRQYVGAAHAVAVNSCTAAMHLALMALGVGPGDEVITTPLTFASTINVILHVGATPVLADVRAADLNVDPDEVEDRVTPRTKAIMPVHFAGHPCDMDEILAIARLNGLAVVEDAAHAAGSSYRGRPVGRLGDATCFSFYAIKNMTTAEGGMVTTDDPVLAERVSSLRNQGLDSNAWKRYSSAGSPFYTLSEPGFNYRMTDIHASLGLGQLRRLNEFNARRAWLAQRYKELFAETPEIETPVASDDVIHNWYIYVVRLRGLKISRNDFAEELRKRGIGSAVHFLPATYHPYFQERLGFRKGDCPVAEAEFERILSLPLFPLMTEADVERVVAAVEGIVAANRA